MAPLEDSCVGFLKKAAYVPLCPITTLLSVALLHRNRLLPSVFSSREAALHVPHSSLNSRFI